ncbi:MAG TPA: hypothetical protein VJB96_01840 [Patescibacteria group bacterium]|nr:hypothetical protein [Patescibacteria group bacterium]
MKVFIILLLSLATLTLIPSVSAAKPRVRTSGTKSSGAVATGYSKAKLSRSTNSVVVTFINLSNTSRVTYTLSYTANGIDQGAVGSLVPSGAATETRDLYFGTCSHGVCTPHRGVQKAVLLVESQLKSGKTNTKRYRIRI